MKTTSTAVSPAAPPASGGDSTTSAVVFSAIDSESGDILKEVPANMPTPAPVQRGPIRVEVSCESFTHLHTAIEYAVLPSTLRTEELTNASLFQSGRPVALGVTSAIAGEGKTTVALHLAMDIARNNFKKVCLIDMSLGDDTLSRRLSINAGAGLVDVLEGDGNTISTLNSFDCEGLSIMPAGKTPRNAARAARSPGVSEVLAASRELFDVIVVDLPAMSSGNVMPIAPHLDTLVLVACAGVTPREVIKDALNRLDPKKVLGVVLNRVKTSTPSWVRRRLERW